jgi:hypothetical protein
MRAPFHITCRNRGRYGTTCVLATGHKGKHMDVRGRKW